MNAVYLSLGCNMGACREGLARAVRRLEELEGVRIIAVSSVYRTEPVGGVRQPDFLNIAVGLETELPPDVLHRACRTIEEELGGRQGRVPMGPRTMDIDILLYGKKTITGRDLTIPHPRLRERAFVLVPLHEIAAAVEIPGDGSIGEALAGLDDGARVEMSGSLKETGDQ
ncbi:2-amino-4-hydroxy-6-hydroxymethyldihydropteridine pyrophosphokinase [bacterium BMS3Abin01]|nr:2-amino-4-hydroxy-6-hydroxymethyldihydropteridine pyrophosphokinase [bacterium BMS3Abin01]